MSKERKKSSKESQEFYENPEVLAGQVTRFEKFLEGNKVAAFWIAGIFAVAVTSFFVYKYYMNNQNDLAQADMFQAVFYFEQDSLDLALNGDGNNYGFRDILEEYPRTDAANLANFYVGVIHMKKGNFRPAILYLEDFSSSDLLVQARAYSLIGDAYSEQGEYQNAVDYYDRASSHERNNYYTPIYLRKAALAYEELEEYESARDRYDEIIEDFDQSSEAITARREKARLEELIRS